MLLSLALAGLLAAQAASAASPIEMPPEYKDAFAQINQGVEVAQLRKENFILQLRLVLKVPNEYVWDEPSRSFRPAPKPPAVAPAPPAQKKEKP